MIELTLPAGSSISDLERILTKVKNGEIVSEDDVKFVKQSIPLPIYKGCGDCTVCCTLQAVEEIGKPYYTKCIHEKNGCSIYGHHPESCQGYSCLWNVNEMGGPENRPDRLGLLFGITSSWGTFWLEIMEVWPQDVRTVLRTHEAFIQAELAKSNDQFPLNGVIYVPYGAKIGLRFKAQPPYTNEFNEAGTTFRHLWGAKFLTLIYECTTRESEERQSKAITLKEMLYGNPSMEQVSYFFRYGEFGEVLMVAAAVEKYLMTTDQVMRLVSMQISPTDLMEGKFSSNHAPQVQAMFADWNDKLGFVEFHH